MSAEEIEYPEDLDVRTALKDARGNAIHLDRETRVWLGKHPVECPVDEDWVVLKTAREVCLLVLAGQVTVISLEDDLLDPHYEERHELAIGRGSEVIAFVEARAGDRGEGFKKPSIQVRSGKIDDGVSGELVDVFGKPIPLQEPIKVYLDDVRDERQGWIYVRTSREASLLSILAEIEDLSLDNDLGRPKEGVAGIDPYMVFGEGQHVANYLVECFHDGTHILPSRSLMVHSDNPVARSSVERAFLSLQRFGLDLRHEREDGKPIFFFSE
jgi:hypothetical protein